MESEPRDPPGCRQLVSRHRQLGIACMAHCHLPISGLLNHLQVGLQAEEAKSPMPGAGLCPGYTISRAILSDAVCLTRGDRFMTTEFTRAWISLYAGFAFDRATTQHPT